MKTETIKKCIFLALLGLTVCLCVLLTQITDGNGVFSLSEGILLMGIIACGAILFLTYISLEEDYEKEVKEE